jgi:hypothetical protein
MQPFAGLSDNNFLRALKRTYEHNELARLVVDEAHVITTWGETFRPEYGKLGRFRDYFPKVGALARSCNRADGQSGPHNGPHSERDDEVSATISPMSGECSAHYSTADEIVASLHMDPEVPMKRRRYGREADCDYDQHTWRVSRMWS